MACFLQTLLCPAQMSWSLVRSHSENNCVMIWMAPRHPWEHAWKYSLVLEVQQPSDREVGVTKEPRAGCDMIWWGFFPLFREDAQAVKQEPGEAVEPPNPEVSKSHLDQALSTVIWMWCWPCFEQDWRPRGVPSSPNNSVIICFDVMEVDCFKIWLLRME